MSVSFIGIGTVKSASTWIFQCLSEHPEVCGSREKEIGFFNNTYFFNKGLLWYESHFSHCQPGQLCGEFTPSYIESLETAQRIKEAFPKVKIIALFRNPIDRLYSFYWFNKINGAGSLAIFDTFEDILNPDLGIIDSVCNGKQMSEFYRLFPKEQIHTLLYEDIYQNPEKVLRDLYVFLGIDPTFIAPSTYNRTVNQTKKKKNRFFFFHKIMFKIFWRIKKIPWIYRLIKKINTQAVLKVISSVTMAKENSTTEEFKKPPMNNETRQKLQNYLKDDIRLLGELIGKDLSGWK